MRKGSFKIVDNFDNIAEFSLFEQLLSLPEYTKWGLSIDIGDIPEAEKICMFGVGESSIAGDIISAYADECSNIPVFNVTSDIVPGWVDKDTEIILVSFSGDNAVINSVYDEVKETGCRVYCLANNGSIKDKCEKNGDRFFIIPDGLTSRSALGFELGIMTSLIQKMGICDISSKLLDTLSVISKYRDSLFTDRRINELKHKLYDNTVAVYGTQDFRASFKRWKMSLNDDMGIPSYCGELPEFNHNEIVGWANHNQEDEDLRIVMLRGKNRNDVLEKIIDKTMEVLEESNRHVIDVIIPGNDPIERNLRAILLADYISQQMLFEGKNPMSWGEQVCQN